MNTNLTVEDIDALREESIREWALAGAGLAEVHRFLARKIEQRLLSDRAALNETIITLEAALSGRHEDVARLTIRAGQLEEALRLAGLGRTALEARTPADFKMLTEDEITRAATLLIEQAMDIEELRARLAPAAPTDSSSLIYLRTKLKAAAEGGKPITLSGLSACTLYYAMSTGKPMESDSSNSTAPSQIEAAVELPEKPELTYLPGWTYPHYTDDQLTSYATEAVLKDRANRKEMK